ncbi:efflux RND transporter permease subunit [Nocardiopsis quinghaiensis]|uniref:efflux RND transporter permease subunit n=1 Tax=Nocardiopsis quinghaiensis TaxID=464995 RepID=UPI001239231A|nr:efflux RND transporter permease subunit [Nocardiopsis quinghaiensis]
MRRLVQFSLRNRTAVILVVITAAVAGVVSANVADRELMPSMEMPMVMVDAVHYGASPQTVEREVTLPLEQAVRSVPGVSSFSSTSSEGRARVTAEFDYGESGQDLLRDIRRATDQAASDLPDGVEVFSQSFGETDIPIVILAVSSEGDEQDLAAPLERRAVPELEALPGVQSVVVNGIREQTVSVRVDEEALEDEDLTPEDVLASLEENGLRSPGGVVRDGGGAFGVTTNSSFDSVEDVEDVWVAPRSAITESVLSGDTGSPPDAVRLSDVADVELGTGEAATLTRTNGSPSLGVIITKAPEGNTVEISDAVHAQLDDLEALLGGDAEIAVVFDQAPQIHDSVSSVIEEGALGIAFAIVVILLFLLSVRSTLIVSLSIPLALLLTVAATQLVGYSLNLVTLGAVAVTIGRLVDDSIVILENIRRHLARGGDRFAAVRDGTLEVATAVFSSTLVTLMVFLPMLFVTGMTGEVFRPFAATVSLALAISLVVALTVVPVLAYLFARPGASPAGEEESGKRLTPLQRGYRWLIRWAVAHRLVTVAAGILLFLLTLGVSMSPWLKTDFIGEQSQNTFQAVQELPAEMPPEEAEEEAAKVEELLRGAAWIESYQVTIGGDSVTSALGGAEAGDTTYNITSDPDGDHDAAWDRLAALLADVDTDHPVVLDDGSSSGSSGVSVEVGALDPETSEEAAEEVVETLEGLDGLENVRSNTSETVRTYEVRVDGEAAADRGLTEGAVGQAVHEAFQGVELGTADVDNVSRDLVLHLREEPGTLDDVDDIPIATPSGGTVRLSTVADVDEVTTPPVLHRVDGVRAVTVTAAPTAEDLGRLGEEISQRLDGLDLPPEVTTTVGGVSAEQDEAFDQMFYAMLAAVAIAYVIMVMTFRSLVQPVLLMVSVPFAATGSLGLLLIADIPLGVPALIGLLMLIGIVLTNAIVLVDLINQYRSEGMELREAVVNGSLNRLRPILMTAVSTMAALTPLALELTDSGGAFMTQPLAVVTIGGLFSSTVLTLVFLPVLYTMAEGRGLRRAERRAERRRRKERGREEDEGEAAGPVREDGEA